MISNLVFPFLVVLKTFLPWNWIKPVKMKDCSVLYNVDKCVAADLKVFSNDASVLGVIGHVIILKYGSNTFHTFSASSFHRRTKRLINEAIMNNDFLKKLEPQLMKQMVDCMCGSIYMEGQLVIQEGEPGNYLYVLSGYSGSFQLHFALGF